MRYVLLFSLTGSPRYIFIKKRFLSHSTLTTSKLSLFSFGMLSSFFSHKFLGSRVFHFGWRVPITCCLLLLFLNQISAESHHEKSNRIPKTPNQSPDTNPTPVDLTIRNGSKMAANPMENPMDSNPQTSSDQLDKVCIIGSGNWGSAIATKVGPNCERLPYFESQVNMWVYEETVTVDGESRKLTEVINSQHENVKYLPGIKLPENVVAVPDLAEACKDATLLIFVLPHQFLPRLLPVIRQASHPSCRGVSLIKGLGKKNPDVSDL